MCSICLQTPCAALCPDNLQTEQIFCPVCGGLMGEDAYLDRDGNILGCENCVVVKNLYDR